MKTQVTFDPPWNFTSIWTIDEGNDYPRLQFESAECSADCTCDDGNLCNGVETCDSGICVPGVDAVVGFPCDLNGSPGACDGVGNCGNGEAFPATSEWGLAILLLMTLTAGTLVITRRHPLRAA